MPQYLSLRDPFFLPVHVSLDIATRISSLGNTQESLSSFASLPVGWSLNLFPQEQPRDLSKAHTQTNLPFLFL